MLTLKNEYAQLEVANKGQQGEFERLKSELSAANLENSALKFRVDSLQAEVNDLNSVHAHQGVHYSLLIIINNLLLLLLLFCFVLLCLGV